MRSCGTRAGFTLVEILIVVIILGILSAVVIPQFANASSDSRAVTFAANLRGFANQFCLYESRSGYWPLDRGPGALPPEIEGPITPADFTAVTPLGGDWDWDFDQFGVEAGISVHRPTAPVSLLEQVDALIDDGDLGTGAFRSRTNGYIFVLRD